MGDRRRLGPVSFLRIFNTATEQIKQGGTGAARTWASCIDFRTSSNSSAKEQEGEFNNFNLSVALPKPSCRP